MPERPCTNGTVTWPMQTLNWMPNLTWPNKDCVTKYLLTMVNNNIGTYGPCHPTTIKRRGLWSVVARVVCWRRVPWRRRTRRVAMPKVVCCAYARTTPLHWAGLRMLTRRAAGTSNCVTKISESKNRCIPEWRVRHAAWCNWNRLLRPHLCVPLVAIKRVRVVKTRGVPLPSPPLPPPPPPPPPPSFPPSIPPFRSLNPFSLHTINWCNWRPQRTTQVKPLRAMLFTKQCVRCVTVCCVDGHNERETQHQMLCTRHWTTHSWWMSWKRTIIPCLD